MVSKKVTIVNKQGMHMRPAGEFVREMSAFDSNITIAYKTSRINAKSIMNLIAACIKCGDEIEIICEGDDEQEMLNRAVSLVQSGFGE